MARDWDLTPSAALQEIYTDHVFGSEDREGGLISNLSGSMSLRSQSLRDLFNLRYQIAWPKYLLHPEVQSGLDHRMNLSDRIEWSGRFRTTFLGSLARIPDSTLFYTRTVAEQSGTALVPEGDTVQGQVGSIFEYETGPLGNLHLRGSYSVSRYENPAFFDSATEEFSLKKIRQVSETSSLDLSYSYAETRIKSQDDFAIHSGLFSYARKWTESLSWNVTMGISYGTEDHRFYPFYGGSMTRAQSYESLSLSVKHSITPGGGLVSGSTITDSVVLQLSRQIAEDLDIQLQETYSRNRSISASATEIDTSTTSAAVVYRIGSGWSGSLAYEYISQRADGTAIGDFNVNRISAQIGWQGEPWR